MRFDINLASQPYEDVQRFLTRWSLALLVLALVTVTLVYAAASALVSWRITEKQTRELRAQVDERAREKNAIEGVLNRAENNQIRDRAQFLNTLISRKAFSWTEVFSDLEKLVPPSLRVTAIRPEMNEDNQLEVRLLVTGSNREGGVELVRRLEKSSHFMHARINSETTGKAQDRSTPNPQEAVQFEISAIYVPAFARTQPQSALPQQLTAATEAHNAGH